MMERSYTERTEAYLNTFLEKEGYRLLKTEFVEEDHNWYLRVYIDFAETPEAAEAEDRQAEVMEAPEAAVEEAPEGGETPDEAEAPAGIGINDCVKVSRRLSKWLDKEDFIKENYTLEVCSRGFLADGAET